MDKYKAAQEFWEQFGLIAYDENTVPENAVMPYITYAVTTGPIDNVQFWSASLWYYSPSWEDISLKAEEIAEAIGTQGFYKAKIDGGYLWLVQGSPFAQRMADEDDMVRRIYITVNAEFLTAF